MSLIDTSQGKIYDLVKRNVAFSNPFRPKLIEITSVINAGKNVITNSSNIDTITRGQLLTAIQQLENTLGRFSTHTDNLSGVSLTNGLNGANLATISQVMATVDKYKTDGSSCEFIHNAFGAIIKSAQIIGYIEDLIRKILDAENYPERLLNTINTVIAFLENQIEQDLIAFANAQIDALQIATANALLSLTGNACISEIISIIGSQELKNIVKEKATGIF